MKQLQGGGRKGVHLTEDWISGAVPPVQGRIPGVLLPRDFIRAANDADPNKGSGMKSCRKPAETLKEPKSYLYRKQRQADCVGELCR